MSDPNYNDNNDFILNLISMFNSSKLFSGIDRASCEALLPKLPRISLQQGDILFEQGDDSDCLYLLIDGQLMAFLLMPDGNQKLVGTVEKGETVGELGVLSSSLRTLTIRAGTNCELLKISHKLFKEFSIQNPTFINNTIDLIVKRNQNTLKIASQKRPYQHIALIQENSNEEFNNFIKKIKENFKDNSDFSLMLDKTKPLLINHCLDQADINNKSIMFILNETNAVEMGGRINHIGAIYIVVNGEKNKPLSEFALSILTKVRTPFATQYELVLLHDDNIKYPTNTAAWLNQADFTLHHHIRFNNNLDYQRLLRFMLGKAIGLVLGGGGIKGWAILGVVKALVEAKIPIDIIGGTSVGALVAAGFAYSLSYNKTEEIFEKLVKRNTGYFSLKHLTWPFVSLFDGRPPTEVLQEIYGEVQNEDLWLPNFTVVSNLSTGKEVICRQGPLWRSLRASAALPGAVPPIVMDGELYVDGGLLNNLPIDIMREQIGNDSMIIAVSLTGKDDFGVGYNFPPYLPMRVWLLRKLGLGYTEYRFPRFFNTFLEAMLLGSSTKEKANRLLADILINPDLRKYGSYRIKRKNRQIMADIGYQLMLEKIPSINQYIHALNNHDLKDKK